MNLSAEICYCLSILMYLFIMVTTLSRPSFMLDDDDSHSLARSPLLGRVQCGRMEVGLSAIKTALLPPLPFPSLPFPFLPFPSGAPRPLRAGGLKGRVPRQRASGCSSGGMAARHFLIGTVRGRLALCPG